MMKTLVQLIAGLALITGLNCLGQATNSTAAGFPELVHKIQAKIAAGKTNAADFQGDLGEFNRLLARQNGARTEAAAQILFMKGMLYIEILHQDDQGRALLEQVKNDYTNTSFAKQAEENLSTLAQEEAVQKIQAALAVGTPLPDFAEKDLAGKPISVGALKGKVVLLDFWATWCPFCQLELPNLIDLYQQHQAEGFAVLGISLDDNRAKLQSFLKQTDGMTWPEYFDGRHWNNKLALKYGVDELPFTILVGPDGKIIGKSLQGAALSKAVTAALAKK
jgi:peroxiredoxin